MNISQSFSFSRAFLVNHHQRSLHDERVRLNFFRHHSKEDIKDWLQVKFIPENFNSFNTFEKTTNKIILRKVGQKTKNTK